MVASGGPGVCGLPQRVPVEKPGSRGHGRENITQARRSLRCKIISGLDLRTPWGGAYIGRECLRLRESLSPAPKTKVCRDYTLPWSQGSLLCGPQWPKGRGRQS